MLSTVILAVGFLLIGEGFAYAVFPSAVKKALSVILLLPLDKMRTLGLITTLVGAIVVWLSLR